MKLPLSASSSAFCLFSLALLLFSAPAMAQNTFEPPEDGYDWIGLTSGEWLKGELISLYDDQLSFESDVLGVLQLDWEDVERFQGQGEHRISLTGLQVRTGALQINDGAVTLEADGERLELAREDLVSITPAAFREIDNWSGDIMLGFSTRQGNTETTEYNLLAGVERRTPITRISLDYLGNYNRTEGEEIANNHRVNGAWDRFTGRAFFWRPLFGQYLRDSIQNIEHQLTVETGLGYDLIDTPRTEWQVSGGVGLNTVRYRSVGPGEDRTNTSPALSLGTDYETEVTPWMDYLFHLNMTFLDEDSGRYQHHLVSTLSTDLVRDWDLDVSFIWDRVENPQERADGTSPEQDDYRLMVGLGFEF